MPVIRSAVRNALSDAISKTIASPWRYFSTFDPVLNSYCELDTAFTPSGDFEVGATFSTVSTSNISIFSGVLQNNDGIGTRINPDGSVFVFVFVGVTLQTTITSSTGFNDGKLHAIKLTYTGTTAELFVDGVSQGTATWALNGSQKIKNIGWRPVSLQYFDGTIADVKLTDLATPANSRIFPLALGPGSSVENSTINSGSVTYTNITDADRDLFTFDEANQRWVGDEELLTNGNFATDTNWTKGTGWSIVGGQAVCASPGGDSLFYQSMVRPSRYLVEVNIAELIGDGLAFYDGATYSPNIASVGVSAFAVTNANTGYNFFTTKASVGDTSIKVNSMSVKRLLNLP
jgi:hypothetical protein